jgi:hypothetical protein
MLTNESISAFAKDWYHKLDIHAPMVDLLPMLFDTELEMVFPEATVYGFAGFEGWFQRVVRTFFDEIHTVKECHSEINDDTASVKVVVKWEASFWNPPNDKSKRIVLDAFQTWELKELHGNIKIVKYIVDEIKYYDGSAQL